MDKEMVDAAARLLKCLHSETETQILGTGLDHIDVDYLKSKGFIVCNCPGDFSSVGLAECAMIFIMMLSRKILPAIDNLKLSVYYKPLGEELIDKSVGILGFGSSARELAKRAKAFGMKIYGFDIRQIEQEILDDIRARFARRQMEIFL